MGDRVVLLGPGGMLGRAFCELLEELGVPFQGLSRPQLDLAKPIPKDAFEGASLVINCMAWTDVDGAENAEEGARRANGDAVGELAEACRAQGATLLHFSTDYVFDGAGTAPYAADAPRRPLGAYGRTKARGEELALATGAQVLIVRVSWLYAPWGKNFVRTIARAGAQRPELKVVNDQRGRPTSAQQLARTSWKLAEQGARGVFHAGDSGECTWFDFAEEIIRLSGASARVNACTSDEYPMIAPRPSYSVLALDKTEALIGPAPHWKESLKAVMSHPAFKETP